MSHAIITTDALRAQSPDSHGIAFGSIKAYLQFY